MVSLNIYKNSANKFGRKTGFKIENEIEDHNQSIPKLIGILTQVFCTFGPNLVILAWTGDELSCRQAQNGVNFDFEVKLDLEGQGQSHGWWVIARTSWGSKHTYGHTHRQTQATTIPKGQNWVRVKRLESPQPQINRCSDGWMDTVTVFICSFLTSQASTPIPYWNYFGL